MKKKRIKGMNKKAEWDAAHTRIPLKPETVVRLKELGRYGETLDTIVSRAIRALEKDGKKGA